MADPLYELLAPYLEQGDGKATGASSSAPVRPAGTRAASAYLSHLTSLSLEDLQYTESNKLIQSSQALLRTVQGLSKRSHKSIIVAASSLSNLPATLPSLFQSGTELRDAVPQVEKSSGEFADTYRRGIEPEPENVARRRRALLLSQNADRISSILELPTLLSSAVSASQATNNATATVSSATTSYGSALDINAHVKRLSALYPDSALVSAINTQTEEEMRGLESNIITSLQAQNLKLATAMRLIGYLRRVAPELDENRANPQSLASMASSKGSTAGSLASLTLTSNDGSIGALFLICRLANLTSMLRALEPLKELADQEVQQRIKRSSSGDVSGTSQGQQTERYLKRYIEIFREQSFAIISMYRNIFPSVLPVPDTEATPSEEDTAQDSKMSMEEATNPSPSPLSTFTPHLVDELFDTLKRYLPNVTDRSARDSLMTQILYCAGSLGRLGGDFSMMLALLEDDDEESEDNDDSTPEWVEAMRKHRIQASRLELLASGIGTKGSTAPSIKAT